MKTGPIPAVVPASLDVVGRPQTTPVDSTMVAADTRAVAAASGSAASGGTTADGGSTSGGTAAHAGPTMADVARLEAIKEEGRRGMDGNAEAMAAQRIALSRLRIEALMLEAQLASATGDAERARAVARAVRTEAGNIRNALRATLGSGTGGPGAASASTAASSAVTRAQAAARKAAAEESQGTAASPALAPWTGGPSRRDRAAVENAPDGVPNSTLHRSAYEALRRAEEVLEELSRVDWSRRVDRSIGDAERDLNSAGRTAAFGLMNAGEELHGALWEGYNGLA